MNGSVLGSWATLKFSRIKKIQILFTLKPVKVYILVVPSDFCSAFSRPFDQLIKKWDGTAGWAGWIFAHSVFGEIRLNIQMPS